MVSDQGYGFLMPYLPTPKPVDTRRYLSFSQALIKIKAGRKMARYGFTKHCEKYIAFVPGDNQTMSFLVLVYPPQERYPEGMTVPWMPDRCSLMENDWYEVHES